MRHFIPINNQIKALHLIALSLMMLVSNTINANSLTLHSVLTASLSKAEQDVIVTDRLQQITYQKSNWLIAFPTLSFNYLESQEISGASEQEVSVNLPLKSPFYRAVSDKLFKLNRQAKLLRLNQRKLYFSGLIRKTLWSYRLVEVELLQANKKRGLLEKLLEDSRALYKANELEHYALLLIEQELSDQGISTSTLVREKKQLIQRYLKITGLTVFPQVIEEKVMLENDFILSNHPSVQILENQWQQQKLVLDSQTSGNAEPWMISFASKKINNGLFEESQMGINFEIPLTFSKVRRQADINARTTANDEYYSKLDRLRVELHDQWSSLKSEQSNVMHQQKLLKVSSELSKKISEQLATLHAGGEISHETWLRRNLHTIDSETALAIAIINNQQIKSMLNQAAGITL